MNATKFVGLALAVTLVACNPKTTTVEEGEKPIAVRVQKVSSENIPQLAVFTANVEPMKKNLIASAQPNRIKKLFVEVGDRVTAGQTLAQMDVSNLTQQKTQIDNFERDYKRLLELKEFGGASQQQVDQIKTQLDVAKAMYNNLIENTTLISPINGVVSARNYFEGDMTGQNPIYVIEQIDPVKVMINLSEQYYTSVEKGMPVSITTDLYKDDTFSGKISLIYPTIDPASRTFAVEVTVPNGNRKLRPGMFARVQLNFGSEMRILVPDMAVIKQAGSNDKYVFVATSEGKANYRKITLGQRFGEKYEIIDGIENGSDVVVAGQTKLIDGSSIEIVK